MPCSATKILVLGINYAPEPTGIAPYTSGMAVGLAGRGCSVRVLTAHPHYPDWKIKKGYGRWSADEVLSGVRVRRLLHYVPKKPVTLRRALSEISLGVRQVFSSWGRPDVIVAVSPALFATALARVRARVLHRGVPFVVWVQDLYTLGVTETGQGGSIVSRVISAVEGWLLRKSDVVIVIHDRFSDVVRVKLGVPAGQIEVIRNWTHLTQADAVDVAATRAKHGWSDGTIVLHAGNMGIKQGLESVVSAARLAQARGLDIRFVMLGDGSKRRELEALAADVSTIEFVAPLADEDFVAALASADILLVNELPGVSEMAVPSKLTSYFSAARPIIAATDFDGITASEIHSADAGVVVAAGEPAALLEAIETLAVDPAEQERLGRNGRRYQEQMLSSTHAIDRFATVLSGRGRSLG